MFTGIVETVGEVEQIKKEGNNIIFTIKSKISSKLKIDQSLSHDGVCLTVVQKNGSWYFNFEYDESENITVGKGSISVNGVSLTVVESGPSNFSVAIIPYTYEHTNFKSLNIGSTVNIEFDMIGKYIAKLIKSSKD